MSGDEATRLEKLLDDGWGYHDTESERLARELEAAAAHGVASNALAPFVHLVTHTIGEHLDDWPRALRLGERVVVAQTPGPETARAWATASTAQWVTVLLLVVQGSFQRWLPRSLQLGARNLVTVAARE